MNVEHEEVLLVPRWVDARRVTFEYGLGREFVETLKTLHLLGLDRTGPEAFPARPFLDLLTAYGSPWGMREQ